MDEFLRPPDGLCLDLQVKHQRRGRAVVARRFRLGPGGKEALCASPSRRAGPIPSGDGVADYVRHLTADLRDLGEEILPVPVLGPREAAERLHALEPDLAHVQFPPSAFGFSARPEEQVWSVPPLRGMR